MEVLSSSSPGVIQTNGTTTASIGTQKKDSGNDPKDNLWSAILSEVQNQSSTKLPSNKSVLVLGDNATGKTTLIAKLQGVEDPKKGSGLEYAYIDVRDEYRDDLTRLGVWVLDGDPGHVNLLKYALNENNFPHTLIILTVSMTAPWSWNEQLNHWIQILSDHVKKLNIPADVQQEAENRLKNAWQNYCETGDDLDANSPMNKRTARLSSVEDETMLPLPDEVLTKNLGLDIVVVVTKTDYMTTLEKEYDYRDEYFDFMQQWIRHFCLQHGASLFYTSVKEDKNCDLLYKYLTHRIYDLPFRTPALVVEKDAVLIPAGWDNLNKISILYENMHSCKAEDNYTDVIAPPQQRKTVSNRESEVQTEDEQQFLARQQQVLMQGQTQTRGESPMRTPPSAKSMPRTSMDSKLTPGGPGGEGVLANFFNSLLSKKANAPGSPGGVGSPRPANGVGEATPDRNTMRTDAAAELDRLTRSVKKEDEELSQSEC
ncbi:cytoplasmic dynein 1 light intermediate chain 1 isoform X2 [Sitodiplosis mosellana]|uniref:cytoplasmic dynein 1 light intermediate chain 1 isoform X2 n=1 Tax=Sitodiplosis mosellana TaxID=263140 RepID=UPI002445160B|nr:cytoplasmic dynein 1 light intermediate chain 1 isoform X2 [Sitodiplosis mosellana]XP_055296542.1 cytoplasmic dynein 1 light intermediate chain 1 isoform X2 [Sitodiplosis mosellana]